MVYAVTRRQSLVAEFLRFLARQQAISQLLVEDGYQRKDRREQFGFPDGLRNLPPAFRPAVVTTTTDVEPDGPAWAIGGTYLTYIKIQQLLDGSAALGGTSFLEGAIGRRLGDGSRLDQPEHMAAVDEPDYDGASTPAMTSHVRKAGPRGDEQSDPNDVFLFRRGVPFTTANNTQINAALHLVAFRRSLDPLRVLWTHCIVNPVFPATSTATDQLVR